MNAKKFEEIKKLAITAMFADDTLMNLLVLKGGNALDIIYKIAPRSSIDLDFSITSDFKTQDVISKLETSLKSIFSENGYIVFDFSFTPKPHISNQMIPQFWGGYEILFKVIEKSGYEKFKDDIENLRRNANVIGPKNLKNFSIEISKFEHCLPKRSAELDGYTIYVYSPEMIVLEKIRAICQQIPTYLEIIGKSHQSARARDFFDIYTVIEHFNLNLITSKNINLMKRIFEAKNVPLNLISSIADYRDFHRPDFFAVQNTVKLNIKLKEFDFYFDYVVNKCQELSKALGVE
ncbi:MAG: nucleotidyl transferase AbiEii/AbiGii toxin family protein [Phycisphaerae bacterium]|nr:nucleotidyl transferase AbiEii/AbiGii toxin family protein [Phycisphaerae bacterium]